MERDDVRDAEDLDGEDLETGARDMLLTDREEEDLFDGEMRLGEGELERGEEVLIREFDRLVIEE